MAHRPALDLELLRTLVHIAEEGSFTRAAERVGAPNRLSHFKCRSWKDLSVILW